MMHGLFFSDALLQPRQLGLARICVSTVNYEVIVRCCGGKLPPVSSGSQKNLAGLECTRPLMSTHDRTLQHCSNHAQM